MKKKQITTIGIIIVVIVVGYLFLKKDSRNVSEETATDPTIKVVESVIESVVESVVEPVAEEPVVEEPVVETPQPE